MCYKGLVMKDLKDCPFCGGKATMNYVNMIHCSNTVNCGCQVEMSDHGKRTKQFTIDSWNYRYEKTNKAFN